MKIRRKARFVGDAITKWLKGEARKVELTKEFSFIDENGFKWVAPKGSIVDGSSIPRAFWRVIGSPFVGLHRRASIIHDVYCVTKSEPYEKVHRMYYDAIRCDGLSKFKAKLMYRAIKIGGPKW